MESFSAPSSFQNACPAHAAGVPGVIFTQLIQNLLAAQCALGNANDYPKDYGSDLSDSDEFDFIVVGAGSAGAVVANRLSENKDWKVLLIEAGGDPSFTSDIPAFLFSTQGTTMDWGYLSEKSTISCLGMIDQRCHYPRGKTLGGTSSINAMLYVRGNADDYDEWERLGNPGWNYDNVLNYFKKSEKLTGFSLVKDEEYDQLRNSRSQFGDDEGKLWELSKTVSEKYHSMNGYLSVSHFGHDYLLNQFKNLLFNSVEELGIPYVPDVNGKNQMGYTQAQGTLHDGKRGNTAKMFLNPIKDRKNLKVLKNTLVQKLLTTGRKVVGVEVIHEGTKAIKATKEVILAAGAINSPQLLMLSGLGPKDHLEKVGIPVVHDIPGVGRNFQDHLVFIGAPYSINKSRARPAPPLLPLDGMYEFLTRGTGIFSTIGMTDIIGFVNSKNDSNVPDLQFHHVYAPVKDSYLLGEVLRSMRLTQDLSKQYLKALDTSDVFLIGPTFLRPESRGYVELNSADVTKPPKIVHNFLAEEEDVEVLLRGVKIMKKLTQTKNFQALEPELVKLNLPKCDKMEFDSDDYWKCVIRHFASSLYHPVGTCKMGPKTDPMAVVDHKLRLHGIRNLRIADASIMPVIVRGNTNAPTIMIGEMAADLIKTDWNQKQEKHNEL